MRLSPLLASALAITGISSIGCLCGELDSSTDDFLLSQGIYIDELARVVAEEERDRLEPELLESLELTAAECEALCKHVGDLEPTIEYTTDFVECEYTANELDFLGESTDTGVGADTAASPGGEIPPDAVLGNMSCAGTVYYEEMCKGGRRPLAHREPCIEATSPRGAYLARMAHLEAASVPAFLELAQSLRQLGAPPALVERCVSAARDEIIHAQLIGRMARLENARYSAAPPRRTQATLFEIALHNAVEGCVHESWAACLAQVQAVQAPEALRAAFARIARDETRHGQLAWDLHAWFMAQLSVTEVAAIERAQQEAFDTLVAEVELGAADQPDGLGLPSVDQASTLVRAFAGLVAAAA